MSAPAACILNALKEISGINDEIPLISPHILEPVIKLKEDISREKLVTYGRKFLAHYKVPKEFYLVTDYPRTASGKIQRYKLLAQLAKLQKIV